MTAEQVGSVKIVGEIDVSSIKAGLESMKNGLDEAKIAARGAFGDLKRTGSAIESIAEPLAAIGVALGTTILGIAALSPAVAPILAQMQVDFITLSRVLGDELKPAFEEAQDAFSEFVGWMGSEEGRGVVSSFGGVIAGVVSGFKTAYDELTLLNDAATALAESLGLPKPTVEGAPFSGVADVLKPISDVFSSVRGTPEQFISGVINLPTAPWRIAEQLVGGIFGQGAPLEPQAQAMGQFINNTFAFLNKDSPTYQNMRNTHVAD